MPFDPRRYPGLAARERGEEVYITPRDEVVNSLRLRDNASPADVARFLKTYPLNELAVGAHIDIPVTHTGPMLRYIADAFVAGRFFRSAPVFLESGLRRVFRTA